MNKYKWLWTLTAVLLLICPIIGCIVMPQQSVAPVVVPREEPTSLPVINYFHANQVNVSPGSPLYRGSGSQAVYLNWSVSGATTVTIEPILGRVDSIGLNSPEAEEGQIVVITATTTFTLTATNQAGSIGSSITITVAPLTQTEKNIQICEELVVEYHRTHTYYGADIYVCGDMACDVWNMLKTRGINAKIALGNVQREATHFTDANHAWVLAEVSPNGWLALEATGGYVVWPKDNSLYYRSWNFYTPKQFREYLALLRQYAAPQTVEDRNEIIRKINALLSY